tara:strand:- start:8619 stop:9860 length:1242 start_codon:yes stop_codon:yes gene_type:complete
MLIIYRFLINLILLISPVILIFRFVKKKEHPIRFKEKFCFFSKYKKKGNLIWFHGASVGELLSIIPIVEKLEKNKKIKQILITSNTLSSSKIIEKFRFKKVIHQFFPIDSNFFSKKFLSHWQPSSAFFIDSEIWPNMIMNLNEKKIPISLINARITKKTFNKWKLLTYFSKKIFEKIDLCLTSNTISKIYLKRLGAKNVKFIGNLKFSQSEKIIDQLDQRLKKFIKSKKIWCASSTHYPEEKFCGNVHKKLKTKYKNLMTIIIPRHIDRVDQIKEELNKQDLRVHLHFPKKNIPLNTDIYLVNAFGKTKSFYNSCNNVFLGGSIVNRGGQNPLEATRFGCNILHGPNIQNFNEIYKLLKNLKLSNKIQNENKMAILLEKLFKKNNKTNSKNKIKKLRLIGKKILNKTYKEIIS